MDLYRIKQEIRWKPSPLPYGEQPWGTVTDANGRFMFNKLTMNEAVLECSKIGYETQHIIVQLSGVQSTSLHIVLSERVTALPSVTVDL